MSKNINEHEMEDENLPEIEDSITEEEEVIEGQDDDRYDLAADDEEPESEPDVEEEPEEKKGKHWSRDKALLDKMRRDNYRYAAQIQELQSQLSRGQEEAASLRTLNEKATKMALDNYELAAKRELERVKDIRKAAYESGDATAMAETEELLNKAVYEHQRVIGLKAEEEYRAKEEQEQARLAEEYYRNNPPQQPQYPPMPTLSEDNYLTSEKWVHDNDWFDAKSPNFDSNRQAVANQVIDNVDAYCWQNGMGHMIGSPQYFEVINQQLGISQAPQQSQSQQQYRGQQMTQRQAPQRSMVAPARNRSIPTNPNGSPQRRDTPLKDAERSMMKRLGVSEAEYRAAMKKTSKNDYMAEQRAQWKERG